MTEPSTVPSATHSVPVVDSLAVAHIASTGATGTKPLPNGSAPAEEEEDYTIKCICDYQDDDGNTVLCETCETWQHIECYYPGTEGPGETETHNCVDCEPRTVDRKRAVEFQRARRLGLDPADRRPAKKSSVPPSKAPPRKKAKAESANGHSADKAETTPARNGAGASPRDPGTAKRPKATHRTSNSTTHVVPLKPSGPSRRSASASVALQSPSKGGAASDHDVYSEDFIHLYDDDPGDTDMKQNLFSDLKTADALSTWCRDPDNLRKDTGGRSHHEVFFRCEQPVESIPTPLVEKQNRLDESLELHGSHPKWKYLTVESQAPRQSMLGILRGKIGFMKDYTHDEANRWEEVRHPLPFVFFHPTLPIYIDTREQGTIFRYIRRSCKPNVHMKTFLENETDYHFCFVTNEELPPGSELTIAWTFDEHMRRIVRDRDQHAADKIKQESPEDAEYIYEYLPRLAAEFGGCACNDPNGCIFVKYRRPKIEAKLANGKSKRAKKGPPKHGNGRTTSSRSGSEALRYQDDDDADDAHSTSASSRSKPQSRDLTPSYGGVNELDALGPDVDDRTKRKIAALEKQETDRHQPAAKKKKRNSGGATLNNHPGPTSASRMPFSDSVNLKEPTKSLTGIVSAPNTPAVNSKPRYADASAERKGSASPTLPGFTQQPNSAPAVSSPTSLPARRADYVDISIQCDMDADEAPAPKALPRRPFRSLTKQLLQRCHNDRLTQQKLREERSIASSVTSPTSQAPAAESPVLAKGEARDADGDVKMENDGAADDISAALAHAGVPPPGDSISKIEDPPAEPPTKSTEPPKPPSIAQTETPLPNGIRAPQVPVPMPSRVSPGMPPYPTVTIPNTNVSTTTNVNASLTQSPIVQTPNSTGAITPMLTPSTSLVAANLVQPSPIKKKLSLGDYMSRRTKAEKAEKGGTSGDKERLKSDATSEAAAPGGSTTASVQDGVVSPGDLRSSPAAEPHIMTPINEEPGKGSSSTPLRETDANTSGRSDLADPSHPVAGLVANGASDKVADRNAMEVDSGPPAAASAAEEGEIKADPAVESAVVS